MAEAAMEEAMQQPQKPDAVFCMSDEILIGVMKVVQQMSLRIPEDTGVISLSNGFSPTLYYPEITYVETSGHRLGKLAFDHMMNVLNDGKAPEELNTESVLVTKGLI